MKKWVMIFGKTDNSKLEAKPLDILRVATEEIHKHEASNGEEYYTGYINRALELIPEKDESDNFALLPKLSKLEPRKMSAHEVARLE